MAWVAIGVASASAIIGGAVQHREAKKAAKKAREQQLEDATQARKAEVFAETEGAGIGQLGQISLEVDDDELDENVSTNLSI